MFQILDLLSKEKLRSFSTLKSKYYRIHDSGFYVYAKKCVKQDDDSTEKCIYTSRPALDESHIIRYEDDRKKTDESICRYKTQLLHLLFILICSFIPSLFVLNLRFNNLAATGCAPVLFRQVRYNAAPELQIPLRL